MDRSTDQVLSFEEATHMVKEVEAAFAAADVERILNGFTPDVVIRFADFPEIHGKNEAERFLHARFSRQKDYQLQKTLRTVMGNMIGNYWEGKWEDAINGKRMKGRGTEFWTIRDGKIAIWEATFNVWEEGGQPATPIV
jgi:nuclear transport factor 2 (NTF2) superfamily protein